MTGPTVGKVTLEAGIDTSQLRKDLQGRLTKDLHDKVMPQLQGMFDELDKINAEIGKVSGTPFQELAKQARIASSEAEKVEKAQRSASRAETTYRDQVIRTKDAIKARAAAVAAERDELRETGKVSAETSRAREIAAEKAAIAIQRRNTMQAEWEARLGKIEEERAKAQEQHARDVEKYRQSELEGLRDLIRNTLAGNKELIDSHIKMTDEIIATDKKAMDDIAAERQKSTNKSISDWLKAEKKFTSDLEKEHKKRAKSEERESTRAAYNATLRGTVEQAANVGRTLSALRFVGMGPALFVIASGIAQITSAASALSQVLLTLPAGIGAVIAVAGTLKISLQGVDDAFKALVANPFDPEKYAESLEKLSPAAARFVDSLRQALPYIEELQTATQDAFFKGFDELGPKLAATLLPSLQSLTTGIAAQINSMLTTVGNTLLTPEVRSDIQTFIDNTIHALELLQPAVEPFVQAMANLAAVGSGAFGHLVTIVTDLVNEFSAWVNQASATGELNSLIQIGVDALEMAVSWVRELVVSWERLAPVGDDLLPTINRFMLELIQALPNIIDLLAQGGSSLSLWADLLHTINPLIGALAFAFKGLGYIIDTALAPIRLNYNAMVGLLHMLGQADDLKTIDVLPMAQRELNQRAEEAGMANAPFSIAPPPLAFPQMPRGPRDQMSPADRWLAADAAGDPELRRQLERRTPPNTYRNRQGEIVHITPPSDPGATRPDNLTEAAAPSASDRKREILESLNPADFAVDPFAPIGGVNRQPGYPGQRPLNVALPGGIPGLNLPRGLPGAPGAAPNLAALGPTTDKATLANAIAQSVKAAGGNDELAAYAVAASLFESGLDPNITNASGHKGLFQMSADKKPGDAANQIEWFINEIAKQGGVSAANADPKNFIADKIEIGGYAGTEYDRFIKEARDLISSSPTGGIPGSVPTLPMGAMPSGLPDPHGAKPQVSYLALLAEQFGLKLTSGKDDHPDDGLNHPKGLAGDFGVPGSGGNTPEQAAFAKFLRANFGDLLNELIYSDPNAPGVGVSMGQSHTFDAGTLGDHEDHIHASVSDANAQEFIQRVMAAMGGGGGIQPLSLSDNMYAANGPLQMDPTTGQMGYFQVDTQALQDAGQSLKRAGDDLQKSGLELKAAEQMFAEGLISQQELLDKQNAFEDDKAKLQKEQQEYAEAERGKFKKQEDMDYSKLPFGDPRRILAGAISGAGGNPDDVAALVPMLMGNAVGAAGGPIGDVVSSAVGDALSVPLPGPMGYPGKPTAPSTSVDQLLHERNPLAPFQMAGFNVPDYSRQGGGPQDVMQQPGAPSDALGRIYSDTAALIDRTFTNLDAAEKARHDQVMTVLNEVKDRLSKDGLEPIIKAGVTQGLDGVSDAAGQAIGGPMGQTAGPIIAQAVASAMPSDSGGQNVGGQLVNTAASAGFNAIAGAAPRAMGGAITGGIKGRDSVPILAQHGEYVLDTKDVALLGGFGGVDAFRKNLKGMRGYATGGGVIANDYVGAEFFGVSQVPIIGAIVNLLVRVLLKILGIEIEERDTLNEMSKDFRDFRGEFQAFNASGQLLNDTSGLVDRSGTSEETAAAERIRILKIVLEALIKYLIEKIIVPISKAIANSLINAGAGAAGGAIGGAFPGGSIVGGAVSGIISTAGQAGVDIVAEIGTDFALALSSVLLQGLAEGAQSYFPGLTTGIFGGGALTALTNPLAALMTGIFAPLLGIFGSLGSIAGPGLSFDSGGLAHGMGMMPKAVIAPERVLSPSQTIMWDRMITALERGGGVEGSKTVHVGGITMIGSEATPENVAGTLGDLLS